MAVVELAKLWHTALDRTDDVTGIGTTFIKASFQSQRKRMKTTRGFAEAAPAAVVSPNLTRDSGARGLQSPDSAVLEKAKQMLKLAQKHGYDTIVARFDNDVQYTVHSTSNGFDREFLRNEDILVKGALPKTKGLSVLEPTDPGGGGGGVD